MGNFFMRLSFILILALGVVANGSSGTKNKNVRDNQSLDFSKVAQAQTRVMRHGFDVNVWMSNRGGLGLNADGSAGTSPYVADGGLGLEYPAKSGIEHLFGSGVWFGAYVDTGRGAQRVIGTTVAYEGWSGPHFEMFGNPNGADSFYRANRYEYNGRNRARFDDDGDGKIDEDELDGHDNDGDWNPLTDDLGIDCLPDSLEVGCMGEYDPIRNPDPAFDNWDSTAVNRCLPGHPFKSDRLKYTQNNGYPNTGEPNVDEDYAAISEGDTYVGYTDTARVPVVAGHVPLGLKVWQRAYSWKTRIKEPILPFEFYYINVGNKILDSVWVGYFADCDVGPHTVSGYYQRNSSGYLLDVRTAYIVNLTDRPSTPIGLTVLKTPKSLDSIKYTFQWFPGPNTPPNDVGKYELLSSGQIKPDEFPSISDTRFVFAFGPFERMYPGDTLKIAIAFVAGAGVKEGFNNMRDNAAKALQMYERGWLPPATPPSPSRVSLRITKYNDRVFLDWKWRPGDLSWDPEQTWDDSNAFLDLLPDTHWRRVNPELGINPEIREPGFPRTGGRIFEGYRVWRSVAPEYTPESFALLRQVDVADDLGFEYNTGLEYTMWDSGLVRGRPYWYSVTSFSIPGITIIEQPDPDNPGSTYKDTLFAPPTESDFSENAQLVILPFEPSTEVGKVKVVPNPYRTDMDYTFEGGGWEGLSRKWSESARVIWFIHLPAKCTIRIFSLAGDLVATIYHDDVLRTAAGKPIGQAEWNLVSESGRAIASGIYVYTVESDFGRQIGKFVVIR